MTTQNDCKRSRNPMEMVSEVNFNMLRSSQDQLGPFEAILELFFGLNLKLLQTSHVTTQNDRKSSRIPLEMVSEVNFNMLRSFRDQLSCFGPKKKFLRWSLQTLSFWHGTAQLVSYSFESPCRARRCMLKTTFFCWPADRYIWNSCVCLCHTRWHFSLIL